MSTWPISGSPAVRRIAAAGVSLVWLCASVIFFLLLTSIAQVGQVPTPVMGLLVLFAILSAWRPELALPMLAIIVPIATWLGRTWHGGVAWPEVFVVAFGAGYAARRILLPHRHPIDALSIPVWTATVVVLASLSVKLLFVLDTTGGAAFQAQLWTVLTRDYFIGHGGSPEIDAAMRLMEGLMLLSAASAIAAQPGRGPVLIQSIVLGAAAAGAVNLWYLWESALRQESPFTTFLRYLRTIRFNRHYADVNAAGSYFVMALFPALAHVFRSWKVASVLASVLIGASLTFSGSRAAMVAGILGALLLAVRGFRRHDFSLAVSRLRLLTAIAVIALCGSVALVSLVQRNVSSSRDTLKLRVQLTKTSLYMIAAAPLFGIGIGEYFGRWREFSSPDLSALFPAANENAHNNFLQLLAELGLVGFGAFMWVLTAAAVACTRRLAAHPRDGLLWASGTGLLAFIVTWLAGHPLLLDAPAFSFWILLGTVAGWQTTGFEPPHRLSGLRTVGAVVALASVVSVPVRVRSDVARADLEHRGIGLSEWHHGEDGVRYRVAGAESTVFLPSSARVVTLPLRAIEPAQELVVELLLESRMADVVRVSGERWFILQLAVPEAAEAPRFRRLDLIVRSQPGASRVPLLKVGKATPR